MPDIIYRRLPDGTYSKTGDLPKGTRYALVLSAIDNGVPPTPKKVHEWEAILDKGPLKQEWYILRACEAPKTMSDDAKEKLRELNERKKAEKKVCE
jgi:hypothetical protein